MDCPIIRPLKVPQILWYFILNLLYISMKSLSEQHTCLSRLSLLSTTYFFLFQLSLQICSSFYWRKMAPPKSWSSYSGKYPKLIVRSITSNSKDVLSGEKYELGEVSVLFPFINHNDTPKLMLRHVRPKRLFDYGTRHNIEVCKAGAVMYSSEIRYSQLPTIAIDCPQSRWFFPFTLRGYIQVYRE